ncbi:PucR family transcriptional regulator [Paenibacillus sp. R14(2021)]|uniref:PucR family transcriptional regulator n=1 Tax=Paenibacillus sp. R14(2021) TaxID=2859228 RepID=UPI001C6168AD|nr:PucR family transcriptional regulator [Paenibacillus sp. R14(2021)]
MSITVQEAMKIGGLTQCKVVAGEKGLNRLIEYIAVMEVPDVIQWLKGNEFLLTSLFSIKDDPQAMEQLVNQLYLKGSSALAIKTSRYIEQIPTCILKEADRLSFPVIEVMNDISYLDIMTPLMSKVFADSNDNHDDLENFFRWLTELAMGGKGIQSILSAIEKFTGNVITIESEIRSFEAVRMAEGMQPLTNIQKREINLSKRSIRLDRVWNGNPISCLVTPLILNEVVYGYVSYWNNNNEFRETDFLILERSIPLMALEFLKVKTSLDIEQDYKDDFLVDILQDNMEELDKIKEKAKRFDWNLDQDFQIFIIQLDGAGVKGEGTSEQVLTSQELLRRVVNKLKLIFSLQNKKVILGLAWDHIAVLYPSAQFESKQEDEYRKQLLAIGQSLQKELNQYFEYHFSIGFGRRYPGLQGISRGYKEAVKAMHLGKIIYGNQFSCHFNDLRIYRILTQFHDKEELKSIYYETVGKLMQHDKENQTNLTDTLQIFFACNARLVETAQSMFVHVNTIKYRLQRIEQITNCSMNNSEERMWLQIGLKIKAILF